MPVFERQLKAIEGFISSEWADNDGFSFSVSMVMAASYAFLLCG